jgi:hypothetical protein
MFFECFLHVPLTHPESSLDVQVIEDIKSDVEVGRHESMAVHLYNYFNKKYRKEVETAECYLVRFLGSIKFYMRDRPNPEHRLPGIMVSGFRI